MGAVGTVLAVPTAPFYDSMEILVYKNIQLTIFTVFVWLALGRAAMGGIIEFWNDPSGWSASIETYTFVDFVGPPVGTFITDQYQHLGITFTNVVFVHNPEGLSDGFGLVGNNGVRLVFDTPQHSIAVDHLGVVKFALFFGGVLVGETPGWFSYADPGVHFSGLISDQPFDEVYLFKPQPPFSNNSISLDNLYWGAPIPAPGALGMFAIAALGARGRRR